MKGYIYSLIDPRNNIIKYVGKTTFNLDKRYKEHIRNSRYSGIKSIPIYAWINELKNENLLPIISLLEEVDKSEINKKEKYWIEYYKGEHLTNVLSGGDKFCLINKRRFTEDHRKKIGDSCRGVKHYNYNKVANNIKSIYMFNKNTGELINEFKSIKEAIDSTGVLRSSISQCLSNKRNSGGEYIWIYKKEYDANNAVLLNKINMCKENPSNISKSRKIFQLNIEDNNIINKFNSIKEAARSIDGASDVAIKYACSSSRTHIYKGYKWTDEEVENE